MDESSSALRCSSIRKDGTTTITVVGELDIATAGQLREYAEEALRCGPRRLVLDLGGVSFFSAAGLAVLEMLSESAARHSAGLMLGELSPAVTHVLSVVGMEGQYAAAVPGSAEMQGDLT
jgi:anti-sigma B factor antagonist